MNLRQMPLMPVMPALVAVLLAGCGTSVPPAATKSLKSIVGTDLPGAQGKTAQDQDRIDSAVAGLCATTIYQRDLCDIHTKRSAARFEELDQ